jgi:hypothetical protein
VEPWNDAVPNAYTVLSRPLIVAPAGIAPTAAPVTSATLAMQRSATERVRRRRGEARRERNEDLPEKPQDGTCAMRKRVGGYQRPIPKNRSGP